MNSKNKHDTLLKLLFTILLFLTLFVRGIVFLDPDFGWRLASGEIIKSSGIPLTDPFTYTMPSYPWINHAWGTDVLIYFLHKNVGFVGLSLFFSVIAILTIYFTYLLVHKPSDNQNKQTSNWYLALPLLATASAALLRFFGVRAQIWTWLFMSIVLNVVLKKELWDKWKFYLPILFIFWVNLHGGFAAGLASLLLVFFTKSIKQRKVSLSDSFVIFLCVLVTFINPYEGYIYKEVWDTLSDGKNHRNILEWNNYFKSFNLPSTVLIVFSAVFAYLGRKKIKLEALILYLFFLYQAITAVRQVPIWAMTAFYVCHNSLLIFYQNLKHKISISRFHEVYKGFYVIASIVFLVEIFLTYLGSTYYSEKTFYPEGAITFLKENKFSGEIFSKYDYGGYLIWKLPEKKVFIDGRMPFWKRVESPMLESQSAMDEYMSIFRGETNYKPIFEKYGIQMVLWDSQTKNASLSEIDNKLSKNFDFLYKVFGIQKNNFSLIKDMESDGWVKVYEDDISVIYQKPR